MKLVLLGLGAGFALTWLMWRLARRVNLVAVPNHRSFHETPTPSGGGVGLVLPVLVGCLAIAPASPLGITIVAGGLMVAMVGFLDDLRHLPSWQRLAVHLVAAGLATWLLEVDILMVGGLVVTTPWVVAVIAVAAIAWLVNLYNFMDGIDGIAGGQCVLFCAGALLIGDATGLSRDVLLITAGAAGGFLVLNWAPARIFMGDVGSGFLGFLVAILALDLAGRGELPLIGSMVLLAGFWFDATYTLCVRMATGQRFASAHRSHFYQKLAERLGHGRTSFLYLAVGFVYLLPLAWYATRWSENAWSALALAVVPFLMGAVALKAGMPTIRIGDEDEG